MEQKWCFAVASAQVDSERDGQVRQWLKSDDRVVIVAVDEPLALTTWALAHDGLEQLVFVGRQTHAPAMAVAANLLTGRLPQLQVSTSTWRTTTLGLAVLSAQVHESAQCAHEAVAQMQQLVPVAWSAAWLPSVTGLAEPRPSFIQHLRSMMPAQVAYLAMLTPQARVARLSSAEGTSELSGATLIMGGQLPQSDRDALQRQAGVSQLVVLPAVEDGKSQYGTSQAVELIWMPSAFAVKTGRPSGWCEVCQSPVWGEFCPFCRVAVVRYQGVA